VSALHFGRMKQSAYCPGCLSAAAAEPLCLTQYRNSKVLRECSLISTCPCLIISSSTFNDDVDDFITKSVIQHKFTPSDSLTHNRRPFPSLVWFGSGLSAIHKRRSNTPDFSNTSASSTTTTSSNTPDFSNTSASSTTTTSSNTPDFSNTSAPHFSNTADFSNTSASSTTTTSTFTNWHSSNDITTSSNFQMPISLLPQVTIKPTFSNNTLVTNKNPSNNTNNLHPAQYNLTAGHILKTNRDVDCILKL
ncbi:bypass of stop codon protein 1-like, partial [Homarus americanus]|uniref:bypass of stop codon protein 1-like n=1 Tax=Homarus americanus TaxID=6706 RepID=UPI001C43986F